MAVAIEKGRRVGVVSRGAGERYFALFRSLARRGRSSPAHECCVAFGPLGGVLQTIFHMAADAACDGRHPRGGAGAARACVERWLVALRAARRLARVPVTISAACCGGAGLHAAGLQLSPAAVAELLAAAGREAEVQRWRDGATITLDVVADAALLARLVQPDGVYYRSWLLDGLRVDGTAAVAAEFAGAEAAVLPRVYRLGSQA